MSGVVIGVGAAIGAVVGGGSAIHGMSKQNRSTISMFKKQMYYMQLNYNYNQAALDRQERSLYDSAVGNLFQLSMNAFQNQSSVEAAQAESGVEGRTQDKLGQVIRGQNARQITSAKEAYEVDVWNVRSKKEALYIETKNAVEQAKTNLDNSLIYGSRAFSQFMGSAIQGAAIGAATAGVASAAGGALVEQAKTNLDNSLIYGSRAFSQFMGSAIQGAAIGAATAGVASAAGGALGGATGGLTGGTAGGAVGGTTVLPTAGITTSATGMLSEYGMASLATSAGTTAGTGSTLAATTGAGSVLGGILQQGGSTVPAATQSTAGGLLSKVSVGYQQYQPYIDLAQQWSNFFNQNAQYRQQRGGYFY